MGKKLKSGLNKAADAEEKEEPLQAVATFAKQYATTVVTTVAQPPASRLGVRAPSEACKQAGLTTPPYPQGVLWPHPKST